MEVQLESPGGLQRQLRVRVPADRVAKAVDAQLKRVATRAKIPGFRPGKAPFSVIVQQYGASARMEAVSDIVQQTYPEAIGQSGVNPAGMPKIDIVAEKSGEALEYTAQFEVYPDIKLGDLKGLTIEKPVVEVSEADVDKLVQNLRNARRSLEAVQRAVKLDDVVTVDFLGKLNGEAFAGGEGKDVTIELGKGQFLPDLENGVVGHSAGETFTVSVKFPEDYRNEQLKGQTAQFEMTLKEVKEVRLPVIDGEFLKAHQLTEADGEAGLRARGRKALEKEREKALNARIKTQALDQLLSLHSIDIPRALIEQEIPRLRDEAIARMNLAKIPLEKKAELLPDALFEDNAKKRVSLGLLVSEVIKSRGIKLDAALVEKALDEMAADYEQPEQVKQFYRSRQDMMQGLSAMVLEEQVVTALTEGAKITETKMTLDELLQSTAASANR